METPILALTRARSDMASDLSPAAGASWNMRLLVQLRWIAVVGQLATILAVRFGLGVPLPLLPMLAVVAALAAANLYARLMLLRRPVGAGAIYLALLFDVVALTVQLHLSGGAYNPFIALFFLQLVLGAILLDAWGVASLVAVTAVAYLWLSLEAEPLRYPDHLRPFVPHLERAGAWISFVLTGGLLAVFVSRVIRNLRARDAYLAEMRRIASEEDAIVRMGLLASGAAHELGTPLSSLSVILGDWARTPQIASDADMMAELREMQSELARCKAILGDILHTVGSPRSEAVGALPVENYLRGVAEAWGVAHPSTDLTLWIRGLSQSSLAAEPALRQVLASLLDNAAEASPRTVTMNAWRADEDLMIAVIDQGPGFAPDILAEIGKPNRSSKGEGRGLGLFLAASLARRIGGRLSAVNRPGGGAEVLLSLPLLPQRSS